MIIAFGFSPSTPAWLTERGVEAGHNGRIIAGGKDRLPFQTAHPRLFAGGDAVRGADLVVTAVAEGRDAAASIAQSESKMLHHRSGSPELEASSREAASASKLATSSP